jgi:outer membrane protein TolC
MDRVKTDIALSRQAAAVAFSKIRAFAGDQLAVFRPLEPDIGPACALDKDHVIASALTTDGEIRRLAIEIARRTASLNLVRWSSVDGAVQMGVGGYADAPRGVGYDLSVTVSLNLPMHHRVAEQSFEQSLRNEIQAFRDEEEQRRRELIADAEAALDNLERARQTLSHALVDAKATREALRVARIRFANLPMTGSAGFEEVETRTTENYVSERAELESRAQVYLLTNQLLLLAPGACGT